MRGCTPQQEGFVSYCLSADALIYLGFPIPFNRNQEQGFWDKMLKKIQSTIAIHSSRSLSVLGRATTVNSLILSRLWHLSWVVKPPPDFLRKVKSAVSSFCAPSNQDHHGR